MRSRRASAGHRGAVVRSRRVHSPAGRSRATTQRMTPNHPLDVRALAGSLLFASIALGAGVVDGTVPVKSPAAATGSVSGVVSGAERYRVVLTSARPSTTAGADHVIEGWGRGFRSDGLAPGRYRLAVIVAPDGATPRLIVPLSLPPDASPLPDGSSEHVRVASFAADFARASGSGRPDDIAPFFDEEFRGPSGQSKAEHLEQARVSAESAETVRFSVTLRSAFRAGDRLFAVLAYRGGYRMRRSGDLRTMNGLFLSELHDDGARLRFVSTESIPLPGLSGIDAIPQRFTTAPDVSSVLVRSGSTTVLPAPIDVPSDDAHPVSRPR